MPFCSIPFCPYTILSIRFCPYHFVRYHFVRSAPAFATVYLYRPYKYIRWECSRVGDTPIVDNCEAFIDIAPLQTMATVKKQEYDLQVLSLDDKGVTYLCTYRLYISVSVFMSVSVYVGHGFLALSYKNIVVCLRTVRHIGVDFGGKHVPPIIENRPCIYHFLSPFAPPIFGLPTQ